MGLTLSILRIACRQIFRFVPSTERRVMHRGGMAEKRVDLFVRLFVRSHIQSKIGFSMCFLFYEKLDQRQSGV